jgi:hypothetical protein
MLNVAAVSPIQPKPLNLDIPFFLNFLKYMAKLFCINCGIAPKDFLEDTKSY